MANPFQLQLSNASAAKGIGKALDYVLPVLMHKQKLQHAKSLVTLKFKQDEDKLAQEALEAKDKMQINAIKTQFDMISKDAQEAGKAGDTGAFQKSMGLKQGLSDKLAARQGIDPVSFGGQNIAPMEEALETFFPMPRQAPPKSIDAAILREAGGDARKAIALKQSMQKPGAIKPYVNPSGGVEFLPNNVVPPAGYLPYSTGMDISVDKDGNISVRTGVPGSLKDKLEISKPTRTTIEKNLFEASEAVVRVGKSINAFRPEYQTMPFRAGVAWEGIKQKMGAKPSPEVTKQLAGFRGWHKKAMRDYGIAVQALGKGNLTKNEEKIYGAGLPNPGDGIWPKDPPKVYWEAINSRYMDLRASIARFNWYLQGGMTSTQVKKLVDENKVISIGDMKNRMDEQGKELFDDIKSKNPQMSMTDVLKQVAADLRVFYKLGDTNAR